MVMYVDDISRCEHTSWNGKELVQQLHHKDGNKNNNAKENLEYLCPNCHTQTDNWGMKGRKHSPESRQKMSECRRGEKHSMYGKHFSEDVKRNMSSAHKGIPSPMKGKRFSDEVRQRMSLAQLGNKNGAGNKGKRASEETRQKMRESHYRRFHEEIISTRDI